MAKTRVRDLSPLQRSIRSRERGIERMEALKRKIRRDAEADIAAVDRRIAEKKVLLDALKRGALP